MTHPRNEDAPRTPKDEQRTPPSLFKKLDDRFHFELDAAATDQNALCPLYFTKEIDALARPWPAVPIYCNPPYSDGFVEKFLRKGYFTSLTTGLPVVFLISSDVSPKYYRICRNAAEWIAIDGRVEFNHEDGTPIKGSPAFGSMVIIFDSAQRKAQDRKTIVTRMGWR